MKKHLADRWCDRPHQYYFNVVGDSFASLLLIVGAILVYVGIRGRKVPAADPQVLPSLTRENEKPIT